MCLVAGDSMFLSKIQVRAIEQKEASKILRANYYQIHQLLWKLFKDKPNDKREFLFRQDLDRQGLPVFYLLSKTPPKNFDDSLIIEGKPFEPKLQAGDKLAFSLRANPVAQLKEERSEEEKLRQEEHRKNTGLSEKITKKGYVTMW